MTTTDPTCIPISCDQHSELELAVRRRRRLRLVWHEANVWYDRVVVPRDLATCAGEEFLIARADTGEEFRIRLDQLRWSDVT